MSIYNPFGFSAGAATLHGLLFPFLGGVNPDGTLPTPEEEEYMDPVLSKVPDASVLANSPSIWYPEEVDANQATLEGLGYARLGSATQPATFQILNKALQLDVPAAHATGVYPGVMIPMAVASSTDFDVVFVFEPSANILAPVGDGTGSIGNIFAGYADTGADEFFGNVIVFDAATTGKVYFNTGPGAITTGVLGAATSVDMDVIPNIMRMTRISNTVYYSYPRPSFAGGWQQSGKATSNVPQDDGWTTVGSDTNSNAVTHACIAMARSNAEQGRVRLLAIWRLV